MYILDSYALLCLFDKKRPQEKKAIISYLERAEKKEIRLVISKINEGEVFYKLFNYLGESIARGVREDIRQGLFPIEVISITDKRVERASEIKAQFPLSYAGAFCIELAQDLNKPILTGDTEFKQVENQVEIVWLGKN